MAADYSVTFDVERPDKLARPHVVIRILLFIVLAFLRSPVGWILGLLYFLVPVFAAIFISQRGAQRFLEEDAPRITRWLRWLVALDAYLALLTDRFPLEKPEDAVRFEVQSGGTPTVGSALLRLIYSIPSALVLALLSVIAAVVWVIAALMVLIQEGYPQSLYNFQRGVARWGARLLAYHASLVAEYPPFSLHTGPEPVPAPAD